jgi:hypothetical protein
MEEMKWKVWAVVCILPAVLFGCLGSFSLLEFCFSPDHGGMPSYGLMGVFLVSASIFCLFAARQLWRGDKK